MFSASESCSKAFRTSEVQKKTKKIRLLFVPSGSSSGDW